MSYVTHANAKLTPAGRLAMVRAVVEKEWTQARVAERFQVAWGTVSKWVSRYRAGGEAALQDHSSRPRRSPNQTPQRGATAASSNGEDSPPATTNTP